MTVRTRSGTNLTVETVLNVAWHRAFRCRFDDWAEYARACSWFARIERRLAQR